VQEGNFREDLFYRLNVFPVALPALRERASDIPLLVRFFVEKYGVRVDRHIVSIAPETIDRLVAYPWPGNVRELQNLIERALILATDSELRIEPEILGEAPPRAGSTPSAPSKDLRTLQREHILAALCRSDWVIEGERGAAKELGLHPNEVPLRSVVGGEGDRGAKVIVPGQIQRHSEWASVLLPETFGRFGCSSMVIRSLRVSKRRAIRPSRRRFWGETRLPLSHWSSATTGR